MTKVEAKKEIALLSSGTVATITGLRRYEDIDRWRWDMMERIERLDVSRCENWVQALAVAEGGAV